MDAPTDTPLARLAAKHGIADHYADIWGTAQRASEHTLKALLRTMGVASESEDSVARALRELEVAEWQRPLPAVVVVRESELPVAVPLSFSDSRRDAALAWRVVEEGGNTHGGEFRPRELSLITRSPGEKTEPGACTRYELLINLSLAPGYHRLELYHHDARIADTALIVTPDQCYRPAVLEGGGRVFGPALQLYALRSERNWGIGDFTDLKKTIEIWAAEGANLVGVNPLCALFPHNPLHCSPYSPSSRLFLNVLYLDVEAIADFVEFASAQALVSGRDFQMRLAGLREAGFVDYAGVALVKLTVLELLFQHFRDHHLAHNTERARAFRELNASEGKPLFRHALFEALQEHFHRQDSSVWGWPKWPEAYRHPRSREVAQFAEAHRDRIEFFQYLQWNCDLQLDSVGKRCLELALGVGLYLDLPVSIDSAGAEAWSNQSLYALSARVGCPPDDWNPNGQDWGLPPFIPRKLKESGYAPWIAILQHSMRHAGALRIDHVMGLLRLFWVPPRGIPSEGAYVYYPFEDLLGILALESQRNRCLVIGEDLGTVPNQVRDALAALGVLSYRLLYFEKNNDGQFKAPSEHPEQALISISTHDLPTLAGYWQGRDLDVRRELKLFPSEKLREEMVIARAQDRARLLLALERQGLLPDAISVDSGSVPVMTPELSRALHRYAARSPAQVMTIHIEDVTLQLDQVNIPATTLEHRNWQKKNEITLERLAYDPRFTSLTSALREERGGSKRPQVSARDARIVIPGSTYRLQLHKDFTFADAVRIVPYLSRLGITHCYCSSYLKARPGSAHGYDIIDHNSLNPEIGSPEDFDRFVTALKQHQMGQVLDIVPNHMGIMGCDNAWWLDVLENGPASAYSNFFDIDWDPLQEELRGKILLPILGDRYGAVLECGELKLAFNAERGSFAVFYHNHCLPIGPRQYPLLLRHRVDMLEASLADSPQLAAELQSLATAFEHLPQRSDVAAEKIAERHRDKEFHKQHLAELCARSPELIHAIDATVNEYNGTPGKPESFELLHQLLELQSYRVADWRVAADEINYRRFFDINDLAALRMENRDVFDATHKLILKLIADGAIEGLRVDHPDGLYDPVEYYVRLQEAAGTALSLQTREEPAPPAIYLVVEKILAVHEPLPRDWQVHGTTGYHFANLLNGLFVDPAGERPLDRFYAAFIGERLDFDEVLYESKKLILRHALSSELSVLAHDLDRIARADRRTRDFTLNQLRDALAEVIACFPVYRTYVREGRVSAMDRRYVDWAVARAKKLNPGVDVGIFDFIHDVLLLGACEGKSEQQAQAIVRFAMKFPQLTSPVMAKGLEDTAFYRYFRLASLNEVGGDPRRFSVSVNAFHLENQDRARRWRNAMAATSTHDNKRSEDVRARINVISELRQQWQEHVRRWSRVNRSKKSRVNDEFAPSRNHEYLLYQTLLGAWPLHEMDAPAQQEFKKRIEAYMIKAVREGKRETSWIHPDHDYESAITRFVHALLAPGEKNLFLADFVPFQSRVARLGLGNSLSQTLIKLTAPGVPDTYQGTEVWDFSLVDPDNRRPVDYARREAMLRELQERLSAPGKGFSARVRALLDTAEDGHAKLYLTWKTLALRRDKPVLFEQGDYLPLAARGSRAENLLAFARRCGDDHVIVVVPRLLANLALENEQLPLGEAVWGDTALEVSFGPPAVRYANVLTGEMLENVMTNGKASLSVATVLANFTVALLAVAG
jgi:(1->4)-alpha-D-glucan 1-alpha-D-glucosylmutase